jgi:hypothetical protein
MDKGQDGGVRLRTRMMLFTDQGAVAVCPQCKTHVPVPVQLAPGTEAKPAKTRVVIRR